jgi:hypothetical protein
VRQVRSPLRALGRLRGSGRSFEARSVRRGRHSGGRLTGAQLGGCEAVRSITALRRGHYSPLRAFQRECIAVHVQRTISGKRLSLFTISNVLGARFAPRPTLAVML